MIFGIGILCYLPIPKTYYINVLQSVLLLSTRYLLCCISRHKMRVFISPAYLRTFPNPTGNYLPRGRYSRALRYEPLGKCQNIS